MFLGLESFAYTYNKGLDVLTSGSLGNNTFGNVSGNAIELAARINNPQKVEEIIAKGGNVLKSKDGFKNALY